jgi:hypothetical protein
LREYERAPPVVKRACAHLPGEYQKKSFPVRSLSHKTYHLVMVVVVVVGFADQRRVAARCTMHDVGLS